MHDYIVLFCLVDDFCQLYEAAERRQLLGDGRRKRRGKLSLSEMLSIVIYYQMSGYRDFKRYYKHEICGRLRPLFRELPCYDRFIALMPRLFMPMSILMHGLRGEETGEYYVDSTHLAVCKNQRISRHKSFAGLAERGKSSMGWFYGFKLHAIINTRGDIIAVRITAGNVDDRKGLRDMLSTFKLTGKCYADKGYISAKLFKKLWKKGLQIITGIRKNMKNYLMPILDKIKIRKRFLIESVFGTLKENTRINPAKHRSPQNYFTILFASIIAYQIKRGIYP